MERIINKFVSILVISLLTFFLLIFFCKKYSLNDCQRVVIATVLPGSSGSPKTGITINYEYIFANHTYRDSQLINAEEYFTYRNQKRFFAKVACKTITISSLILTQTVPDSIRANPAEGWENVPIK